MNQLIIFACQILSKFIIKLVHIIILRILLLILKRKRLIFWFLFIKLVFDIFKLIGKQYNLFNFFFNLLLMIILDLSEPFIYSLIIFLNNTRNQVFAFKSFLINFKFNIIWHIINLGFLYLNRKNAVILILMWLCALSSLFAFFGSLS